MMKMRDITMVTVSLLLASVSLAEEQVQSTITIEMDDGSDAGEFHLQLDSDDMGFDLHDLQEGETRSIVDESGRSILITREAEGIKLNVDGKTIDMPLFDGLHGAMIVNNIDDIGDIDADVHVIRNVNHTSGFSPNDITIVSGAPIDDVTRGNIKSLLTSSGHSGEVQFIDRSAAQGGHGVHKAVVISKEVAVTH